MSNGTFQNKEHFENEVLTNLLFIKLNTPCRCDWLRFFAVSDLYINYWISGWASAVHLKKRLIKREKPTIHWKSSLWINSTCTTVKHGFKERRICIYPSLSVRVKPDQFLVILISLKKTLTLKLIIISSIPSVMHY